jgi:hypothetical protein
VSDDTSAEEELFSARAILGLVLLAAIGLWYFWSIASNSLTSMSMELNELQQNISRLENLQQEAALLDKKEEAASAQSLWEQRLLTEGSRGLNMIALTDTLSQTLSECGVQVGSPEVEYRPDEQNRGFDIYTASVQSRDPLSRFPICLNEFESLPIGLNIDELVWTHTGTLILVTNAYGRSPE